MKISALFLYSITIVAGFAQQKSGQVFRPEIPQAWEDHEIAAFQVPLVQRDRSPRYLTPKEYYALKVRPIYRTYPVYAPSREPAGYMEALRNKEPEIIFDASTFRSEGDWIRGGEMVFDASTVLTAIPSPVLEALLRSARWPITGEGIVPYFSYVVRQKGVLEVGVFTSCASCHTRVLPDGTPLKGAQGNPPTGEAFAALVKAGASAPDADRNAREGMRRDFGAPWVVKREESDKWASAQWRIRVGGAKQPGVFSRHGSSPSHPTKIPSLIGLKDIEFLDATGLMRHRSIGDLMRYVITNYGLDITAHYGDFQPAATQTFLAEDGTRFSDEQLYALALYIYSLEPPENPNGFDDEARRGQRVFQQQGCPGCHTPPVYTNNKLTPVRGFTVPADLRKTGDIMNISVGTDPTLATQTRRGTGFYKVPSLRGVWYRNAFSHNGQAETLEEWLDPARLRDDYIPQGFHLGPGAIKGHEFGLKLTPAEKQALIAFLKTL